MADNWIRYKLYSFLRDEVITYLSEVSFDRYEAGHDSSGQSRAKKPIADRFSEFRGIGERRALKLANLRKTSVRFAGQKWIQRTEEFSSILQSIRQKVDEVLGGRALSGSGGFS